MVANLILGRTRSEATDLLSRSFAQFQLDRQDAAVHQAAERRTPPSRQRSSRPAAANLWERMEAALRVLEARGMADGWSLQDRGLPLAAIHNEADLLVVESLDSGLLESLDPAMLGRGVLPVLPEAWARRAIVDSTGWRLPGTVQGDMRPGRRGCIC